MEVDTAPLPGSIDPVITIGIIDNVQLVVTYFTSLFNSLAGIQVILQAGGGADALQQLRAGCPHPDVVLVDVTMLPMDGLQTSLALLEAYPALKLLAFTSAPEGLVYLKMLAAGCYGYLCKTDLPAVMEATLRRVHGMKHPGVLPGEARAQLLAMSDRLQFTVEEQDRLQLYCQGYDNQVVSTLLEQKLDKLHQQQHSLVRWLSKLFSVVSKLFEGRVKQVQLSNSHRRIRVALRDILYVEAKGAYVRVCLQEGKFLKDQSTELFSPGLGELGEQLRGTNLVQIGRSYIINVDRVLYVDDQKPTEQVIWIGDKELKLSKGYSGVFYSCWRG